MVLAPSYGKASSPRERRGVIAPNHLSAIDPALVGARCPRTIFYMAKAELSRLPVVGEALQWTGAFPVRRGEGDRELVRQAREIARAGYMVGMFVEGTRQRLGYPGRVLPGGGDDRSPGRRAGHPVRRLLLRVVAWKLDVVRRRLGRAGRRLGAPPLRTRLQARGGARRSRDPPPLAPAAETVAAGFPAELPDGALRAGPAYRPLRTPTMASPSTSVKKAAA
ncbi:MAG: lysophospholipid acyltransferase family protein [Candidatus Limnocylindria bacterium]